MIFLFIKANLNLHKTLLCGFIKTCVLSWVKSFNYFFGDILMSLSSEFLQSFFTKGWHQILMLKAKNALKQNHANEIDTCKGKQ